MSAQTGTEADRPTTVEERAARGKRARAVLPLQALEACPEQPLDAVAVLRAGDPDRVADLLPVRYGRMLASAFTFYRGAASVMAADLSTLDSSGLTAQLCGDAHLSNFGVYASPERRLVFDLNDFDETLPGPFEWDVRRLAASLTLAGRDNGVDRVDRVGAVATAMRAYRLAMRDFAGQGNLAVWYANLDVDKTMADLTPGATASERRRTEKLVAKARGRTSQQAAGKLTVEVDGRRRFIEDPPLLVRLDTLLAEAGAEGVRDELLAILAEYRGTLVDDRRHLLDQFELVDVARKVVGVGSVGTRAFVLLMTGRDPDDTLVLQVKEAGASVLEPYWGSRSHATAGERVVTGQRLMQATSDIFLGWQQTRGLDGKVRDFYVRQLRDGKGSVDVASLTLRQLTIYGELCAWTLARAHARSGDRVAIAAYLGKKDTFEQALARFGESYADRVEQQHAQLDHAALTGGLEVTSGI